MVYRDPYNGLYDTLIHIKLGSIIPYTSQPTMDFFLWLMWNMDLTCDFSPIYLDLMSFFVFDPPLGIKGLDISPQVLAQYPLFLGCGHKKLKKLGNF